ncbi:hypothetical protein PUNSTDRAFT_136546 [Punctularia strigosozonata HHB-11173 SS5]|uniref:uncharacterized protein n=1 Tax=Punctularia strigosozonata (strain HHB-11173) TaxID=741275 RepID=UPI0004417535|nr:uncharacterized protein PUNSTDRAFT_136546 [Punctularia strigosozonata HHB-11173 SS5]EIN06706.1 hypothetical protein PUNSTDRAFT_136546 [Punctularia strigosozonata HHB-11173 SS5]
MPDNVNPRDDFSLLILWSTFNIFAGVANLALLITSLSGAIRTSRMLMQLEGVFVWTTLTGSLLIWTGHALDRHPPFGLCLVNAAFTDSNVAAQAGAALSLVLKVWAGVMGVTRPNSQELVRKISSDIMCFLITWVFAVALFWATFAVGIRNHDLIYRGSPFYCTVDNNALQTIPSVIGAVFTLATLILALWTVIIVAQARWRVRSIQTSGINYRLVIRVFLFSIFVGVAFIVGVISILTSFEAVVPDSVISSTGVALFIIFASSKDVAELWFCCRRPMLSTPNRTGVSSRSRSRTRPTQHELSALPHASHANDDAFEPSKSAAISDPVWRGTKTDPSVQISVQRTVDVKWDADSEPDLVAPNFHAQ